ncbi:CAIB/BAIF family enzyme [Paraphoma chrysanthemicola]|uniref:CAIB/BAIF family enzyme n=1 Tax=Paraphoma chrysanthemicola TaxID=798071 RepID=A0A8K0R8Z9_9PLEO|nr:CAIB/BAIF family enzyme [Paraphoma chrysanthemicola]
MTARSTIAEGAQRALEQHLLADSKLNLPSDVLAQKDRVKFTPDAETPFLPTSLQMTESSASLWALLGMLSNSIVERRYGATQENIEVNVYSATLFLMSAFLYRSGDKGIWDPYLNDRTAPFDHGKIRDRYRILATNIYQAKDKRFYHLHGSLDTSATLEMLGLPQFRPDLEQASNEEIKAVYAEEVAKHDSEWLDIEANEHRRQAGTICYTFEEFTKTSHGKVMMDEPLYSVQRVDHELKAVSWPSALPGDERPLAGIKVIDITRVIAGPTISRVLSLLGADVLRISHSAKLPDTVLLYDTQIGKRDTTIDLKSLDGKKKLRKLIEGADVFIDGYRPGAMDRLGFSRKLILEIAKRRGKGIVHARENCYGWKGEWSHRSGWQQIADAVSGATWAQGKYLGLDEPAIPLLPNSDYQTGMVGAIAIVQALSERAMHGGSYAVDTSLTQYNIWFQRLGLFDENTCSAIRSRNEGFKLRHNTELPAMVNAVKESSKKAAGEGAGKLWDQERFTESVMEWGKDGELASHVDWSKIVSFTDQKGVRKQRWAHSRGSCKPGSHEPEWL